MNTTKAFTFWKDLNDDHHLFKEEIKKTVLKAIDEAQYILGPSVKKIEKSIENWIANDYKALAVGSGTDALKLILYAIEQKQGKGEIILPAFGFYGISSLLCLLKWKQVFIDIHPQGSYGPYWDQVEAYLKVNGNRKKVKAILITHLFGLPIDEIDRLKIFQNIYPEITIIEDNCQGFGSFYKEGNLKKPCGSFGSMSYISFYPTKLFSAMGDGGMIFTQNLKDYHLLKKMRNHGEHGSVIGFNSRLDSIQAHILNVKWNYWNLICKRNKMLGAAYEDLLKNSQFFFPWKHRKDIDRIFPFFAFEIENRDHYLKQWNEWIERKKYSFYLPYRIYYSHLLFELNFWKTIPYKEQYKIPFPLTHAQKKVQRLIAFPISLFQEEAEREKFFKILKKFASFLE